MTRHPGWLFWFAFVPAWSLAAAIDAAGQEESGKVPERSDIAEKYKWDLSVMYADEATWSKDLGEVQQGLEQLAGMEGKPGKSPEALLQFLKLREDVTIKLEKVYAYAQMLYDQDTRNPGPQAMQEKARNVAVKMGEALAWFNPEVLAMPEGQLLKWCVEHKDLKVYTHHFEDLLRQKRHVLSPREEELLAMTGNLGATPHQAFNMLTNADMKFPTIKGPEGEDVELSEGRYSVFLQHPDRALRERAFKGTLNTYLQYKNTLASLLAGSIHGDVFEARARKYDSALHAALDPDKVPLEVYTNLIATVREHLPKLHRYYELRRNRLQLDQVHLYDMFVPLIEGEAPKIQYDAAVQQIIAGLKPMGPEYLEPMQKGFTSRWIDVHETQGKRSGAYSMGTYATHPFILLNYNDTYEEMFTVAHEMGHSMHTWFTQHNQPPVYGDYPTFLAEVASTCNEVILGDYLRKKAEKPEEKLFLLNMAVEGIRGTVITQTMWAEFELRTHAAAEAGAPLNYEALADLYRKLVTEYYGPAYAHDVEVDGYWARIPHFYRAFYVYKYATSYCASVALAQRILKEEPDALQDYLGFLKAGSSDYPIEILKKAGVDMSTPKPIHATMELFGELLGEMEGLLKS